MTEAKVADVKAPAPGTLHKPVAKPETAAKQDKKGVKKQAKGSTWRDDTAKKRTIKTRGDEGGVAGWHARKDRTRQGAKRWNGRGGTAFSLPTEPVIHEVLVPETISCREPRAEDGGEGR